MANTDVTITLAEQFRVLDKRQVKLAELGAKIMLDTGSGTKPTVATWNNRLSLAVGLFPPQCARNLQVQRAAMYWQQAVSQLNTGLAIAGRSNSQILDITSYLQGCDDPTLDALSLYLEGRGCLFTAVYT